MTRKSIIHDFLGYGKDPESQYIIMENYWRILNKVKPRQRELLILKFYEGYSNQIIAEMTGRKSSNSVAVTISQLVKKLRIKQGPVLSSQVLPVPEQSGQIEHLTSQRSKGIKVSPSCPIWSFGFSRWNMVCHVIQPRADTKKRRRQCPSRLFITHRAIARSIISKPKGLNGYPGDKTFIQSEDIGGQ